MSKIHRTRSSTTKKTNVTTSSNVDTDSREASVVSNASTLSFSPSKRTRLQEKAQLSGLNNRLAAYIEKVRSLEAENAALSMRIQRIETEDRKEERDVTAAWKKKCDELRNLVDTLSSDKTRLEVTKSKAVHEITDVAARLERVERELKSTSDALLYEQNLTQELKATVETEKNRRNHCENERRKLADENKDLKDRLKLSKKAVEDEIVLRTDLQNKVITLEEELEFEKANNRKKIDEFHKKKSEELTILRNEMDRNYNDELVQQLQSMRAECDARITQNRKEMDALYKKKFTDSANLSSKERQELAGARAQITQLTVEIRQIETKYKNALSEKARLVDQIEDLESRLAHAEKRAEIQLASKNEDIARLEKQIQDLMDDYSGLMDVKIQLDTEIEAYRRLLEGEETRLNISSESMNNSGLNSHGSSRGASFLSNFLSSATRSSTRGTKRPRFDETVSEFVNNPAVMKKINQARSTSESFCAVTIEEFPESGDYIKLKNNSNEEVPLGKWQLSVSDNEERALDYTFNEKYVLPASTTLTIWSKDAPHATNKGDNIAMKTSNWPTGETLHAILTDADGEKMATRDIYSQEEAIEFLKKNPDQSCCVM
uniref:LTD domain-containing protein n=1 Tax=Strongyloides papillosus TaxID=174720 RepID=A0A0N5BKT1_STREA